jgi:threonyl-tRNA synthetase
MKHIASRNLAYRREEISKAEALRVFNEREEPLKRVDDEKVANESASTTLMVHRLSISPRPYVSNTNKLRAFKLLSLAGAYWKGDAAQPQMQRMAERPSSEELDAWLKREEAEKRDHRRLGRELDLFSFSKTTVRA